MDLLHASYRRATQACGALVGVLRLIEYASGGGLAVDEWFFRVPGGQLGLAPIGKMSLPTAVAFISASSAVVALAWPTRWKSFGHTTGVCGVALVVGTVGVVAWLTHLVTTTAGSRSAAISSAALAAAAIVLFGVICVRRWT